MHSYAQTDFRDESLIQPSMLARAPRMSWICFWLPLAAIGVATFSAEHLFNYADPAYLEEYDTVADVFTDVGAQSLFRELSFIVFGAVGAALLLRRAEMPVAWNWRLGAVLFAAGGWVLLSAAWSDDPVHSLKRSLLQVITAGAVLGIAKHWQPRQVCLFTVILTGFFAVLGIASECVAGTFLVGAEYRFAGTLHPNVQAVNCALLSLASLALARQMGEGTSNRQRIGWLLMFFVGLGLLVLTKSRSATAGYLAGLFMFITLGFSPVKRLLVAGVLLFSVAIFCLLALDSDSNSGLGGMLIKAVQMGREQDAGDIASLTGRVPIWNEVLRDIGEHPICGYGYGSFWTPQRVLRYSYIHDWEFSHAHSAYLETLLNVGAIGLALGLLAVLPAAWLAARAHGISADAGYRFIAALLSMGLVHGILDSNFVAVGLAPLLCMLCIFVVAWHGRSTAAAA